METKTFSPEEAFDKSPIKTKIIDYFIERLGCGQRVFSKDDTLPESFNEVTSIFSTVKVTSIKKLSDVLPLDFQKRIITEFENAGWDVEVTDTTISFSERNKE